MVLKQKCFRQLKFWKNSMQNIHLDFAVSFFANESIIHIWDTVLFHSLEAYRSQFVRFHLCRWHSPPPAALPGRTVL
jgi:hypothetical protein